MLNGMLLMPLVRMARALLYLEQIAVAAVDQCWVGCGSKKHFPYRPLEDRRTLLEDFVVSGADEVFLDAGLPSAFQRLSLLVAGLPLWTAVPLSCQPAVWKVR